MSHDIWPASDGFRLSWQPADPTNLADFKQRLSPTACIQPEYKWEIGNSLAEVEELLDIADEYELAWHPEAIADARTITEERRQDVEKLASGDYEFNDLEVELRSYQEDAVATMLNEERVLLADEMGLGKSYSACGALVVGQAYPALVAAPANAIWMWRDVLERFGIDNVQVLNEGDLALDDANVWVTTWDLLRKYVTELKREPLKAVILDEAHHIRNGKLRHGVPAGPKRAKAAYRVTRGVPYRWLLSGTFWHNHEQDILFPLQVLDRLDDLGGFWRVAKRFCGAEKVPMGNKTIIEYEDVDEATLKRFNDLLRRTCLIRRTKDEVEDLPPRRVEKVPVDVNVGIVPDHENPLAQEAALREAVGKAKIEHAVNWVNEHRDEVDGLVVFAYHTDVVSEVAESVESAEKIDGSTPKGKRRRLESAFQDGEFDVLVGQLQAMGEAMTLTRACDVLFVELWWSPAAHKQAMDRCVVEGQRVQTSDGFKPIEEVDVGDEVLTHRGRWRPVTETYSRRERGVITEIEYEGSNQPLEVTADHEILVRRGGDEMAWVEAQDLMPKQDELVTARPKLSPTRRGEVEIPAHCLLQERYEHPGREGDKPSDGWMNPVRGDAFSEPVIELTEESLFAMGYYLADGYCPSPDADKGDYISFSGHQEGRKVEALKRIGDWVESLGINTDVQDSEQDEGRELRAYSAQLANAFREWFGRTSAEKRVPEWIWSLNQEQAQTVLEGYLTGDGYRRNNQTSWNSVSPTLASGISLLACSVGEAASLHRIENGDNGGSWRGAYTENISESYRGCDVDRDYVYRKIRRVEHKTARKGNGGKYPKVYDLTVEGEHSFTVTNAIVHNCHRIGQDQPVTGTFLVAKDTVDERVWDTIEAKASMSAAVTDGIDVSEQDIREAVRRGL